MGYRNAQSVFVLHHHHRGNAFRLLTYMALRADDRDAEPTFTGTREDMAFALGINLADAPSTSDTSEQAAAIMASRTKALQAVSNALRALYRTGVVETPVGRYGPDVKVDYRLHLFPTARVHEPVDNHDSQPVDNYA